MECRSRCVLDTVRRRWTAPLLKADVMGRMPGPRSKNREAAKHRLPDPFIEGGHNFVPFGNGKTAPGTEIILNVDDQQRVAGLQPHDPHCAAIQRVPLGRALSWSCFPGRLRLHAEGHRENRYCAVLRQPFRDRPHEKTLEAAALV